MSSAAIVPNIRLCIKRGLHAKALQLMKRHKYVLHVKSYRQIMCTLAEYMYDKPADINTSERSKPYDLIRYIFYESPRRDALDPSTIYSKRILLNAACAVGCIRTVALLMDDPRIPKRYGSSMLVALNHRRTDIIRLFLQTDQYKRDDQMQLININININITLRRACETNQPDVVRMLLLLDDPGFHEMIVQHGAEFLEIACKSGCTDIVRMFVEDGRVDPSVRADVALCSAAMRGHRDIVTMLLCHPKVNPYAGALHVGGHNTDPILFGSACKHGWVDLIEQIMLDTKFLHFKYSTTPLETACCYGKIDIVRIFVHAWQTYNLEIFDPTHKDFGPMLISCDCGRYEIAKLLIEAVELVKPVTAEVLERCLIRACKSPSVDLVSYILKLITSDSISARTFADAVFYGRVTIAKLLIDDGRVDIFANYFEAMMLAISGRVDAVIEYVFGEKCDETRLSSLTRQDYAQLMYQAAHFERHDFVELFERRMAKL